MLLQKLYEDRINTLKSKNSNRHATLQFLLSEASRLAKADSNRDVTDDDIAKASKTLIKQVNDTIAIYRSNFAPEPCQGNLRIVSEIDKLLNEKEVLEEYGYPELTEEEIENKVRDIISNFTQVHAVQFNLVIKEFKIYLTVNKVDANMKEVTQIIQRVIAEKRTL